MLFGRAIVSSSPTILRLSVTTTALTRPPTSSTPSTTLEKGQVTAQGLFLVDNVDDFNALETPIRFAITGGTGPYATARGTITEGGPIPESRLLDIEL
jgi:hypothetical protein